MELIRRSASYMNRASIAACKTVLKYPKTSCLVIGSPLAHFYLEFRGHRRLISPISARLEEGTRPPLLKHSFLSLDRSTLANELTELFLHDKADNVPKESETTKESRSFKVVLGPSGTGKTALVRQVCNEHPKGVLYHEIFDPGSVAKELAKAAGVIVTPGNLFDLVLTYVSNKYRHYHTLPEDASQGVAYVLDRVHEQAVRFKVTYGYSPIFVIDGIDLVAKKHPRVFVEMIDRAKYLSNLGALKVVFVSSSEGSVLPLLDSTSSRSRRSPVVEIVDVSDDDAARYLQVVMPEDLSKEVVALTGGRLVYMLLAIETYKLNKDDKPMDSIRENLISHVVRGGITAIQHEESASLRTLQMSILKSVVSKGSTFVEPLAKELGVNVDMAAKAVDHLVAQNFLRYQPNRRITYHSKLVLWFVKNHNLDEYI